MEKVVSCPNCGVLFLSEALQFPPECGVVVDGYYTYPKELYVYRDGHLVPLAKCPICKKHVIEKGRNL